MRYDRVNNTCPLCKAAFREIAAEAWGKSKGRRIAVKDAKPVVEYGEDEYAEEFYGQNAAEVMDVYNGWMNFGSLAHQFVGFGLSRYDEDADEDYEDDEDERDGDDEDDVEYERIFAE